ncbi:nuclear transport factor 2 family protein [Allokutzneria sp. A3M-2-11 16]|uniref:nuclear transport factor 2 family protein n=1 Tax=Allokutzneria sp. A3M-2-11 16 TaxID=2962043 RepID=UPI0020B7AEB7|nr:nuclear transport factor 2 family protein [Allokutzneria sp. A3M-2-11 16]MCP3803456.1 nuclear transport factor 2 family protein [Allokutzneria sp. A3M-2-11 16]
MSALPNTSSRVQEIADRLDVVDVVVAYATALDTKDWALLGSLFTDAAIFEFAGRFERQEGPAAIVALISAVLGPLDATQHINTNHVVTVHGDEAEHTCYFQAQHVRRGLPGGEQFIVAGAYVDRLRRTPGGWRFAHRSVRKTWMRGNSEITGHVSVT